MQTSVGTAKFYGVSELYGMLKSLIENAKVPVYLHLDHCNSVELAKECVDAGWDSVMIDASKYPIEENIKIMRETVNSAHDHGVEAEGELGIIKKTEDKIQSDFRSLPNYEDCLHFARESGADLFAPALGTAHGVYHGTPVIQYDLAERLCENLDIPIVCHGGTGLSEETFMRLIQLGVSKINISTALKHAYIDGAKEYISKYPDTYAPLEIEDCMYQKLKETISSFIVIFSNGSDI